ncbi:hypothetical protein LTR17_012616 [Elasticomyces elasticus]|nr:hypothetical protein LTR17_012616 [Elasticomyces elasticus]
MADKVAGEYYGRWVNAERELFELKKKLSKQQDIIGKVANGMIVAEHNAASADIILLENESVKKQKQIEELELSLETKDLGQAIEVEKLIAEIDGLKLELVKEQAKQYEVTQVPGSKVESDLEDGCAAVLTPASSISEQAMDDTEAVEQDDPAQHSGEPVATDPLVIGLEHDEPSTTSPEETSAVESVKPMTIEEVFEAYERKFECLAERKECFVSRKAEKVIEAEWLDICKKYGDLMNTALPAVMDPLDPNQEADVQAQKLIESVRCEIREFRATQRFNTIDQRKAALAFELDELERRMLVVHQVEKYPVLEPIIACFMEKLEGALRA